MIRPISKGRSTVHGELITSFDQPDTVLKTTRGPTTYRTFLAEEIDRLKSKGIRALIVANQSGRICLAKAVR